MPLIRWVRDHCRSTRTEGEGHAQAYMAGSGRRPAGGDDWLVRRGGFRQREHDLTGGRLHLHQRQHCHCQYYRRVRPARGRLAYPLAGSPFIAGGAGLGTGLASQGAIQVSPDGRYLLAVDAGSNQVSVLRLTAGGVPVLAGQPVPSGGIKPVSVAISRSGLVYVANQGNGGSNYTGFWLSFGGRLTPI